MARRTTKKRSYPYIKKSSSSIVKRAKGNIAASKKQNDVADFTITFNHTFPIAVHYDENYETNRVYQSGYALNIWDLLSKAPNFKAFQSMYDQVRINGVQIKLGTTNGGATSDDEENTIYNVFTAWDSNGSDKKFIFPVSHETQTPGLVNILGYRTGLNTAIATYGSASKLQLNKYQRWTQNRSLYPSNMAEKTQFVSCDSIIDFHRPYDTDTSKRYFEFSADYKSLVDNINENDVEAEFYNLMNQDNPALPCSNAKYPFKPTFYVDAYKTSITDNKVNPYTPISASTILMFTAEIRVPCTFRGLKGVAEVLELQAQKNVTITENNNYLILPDDPYDAMKTVNLTVNVPQPDVPVIEEDKYQYIDSNGPLTISPTNGYDVMEKVSAVVAVPVPTIESSKSYTIIPPMFVETYPLTFTNQISPSTGYDAMASSTVTVNLVDSSTNAYLLSNIDYVSEDGATRTVYYKAPTISDNAISSLMTIMSSEIKQNNLYSGLRRMNFKAKVQNRAITQNGVYYANDNQTILNKVTVNVPTKQSVDRISYEGNTYLFSNFSTTTSTNNKSVPNGSIFISFGIASTYITFKTLINNTGAAINVSPVVLSNKGYYLIANPQTSSMTYFFSLINGSSDAVMDIYPSLTSSPTQINFSRDNIDFVI